MDDDDYHYSDSILAKIRCLQKYKKKCIFSSPIGVYNLNNNTSQIVDTDGTIPGIPEATLTFIVLFGKMDLNLLSKRELQEKV